MARRAKSMKKPWQSKTMWANLIMAVGAFLPQVQEFLTPEKIAMVMGAVNWALRFITKDKISFD